MNNKGVIRVEVADDHPVVREGLTAIINQCRDMQVVAEAANGREAIDQFLCHRPDVVLMDLRMPEIYVRLTEGRSGPHLSDREMGVLRCMVNGKSNREIAAELRIAEGTVKVHVHRILHKLGAKGRAEAISTTLKKGIVHLPESTSAQ